MQPPQPLCLVTSSSRFSRRLGEGGRPVRPDVAVVAGRAAAAAGGAAGAAATVGRHLSSPPPGSRSSGSTATMLLGLMGQLSLTVLAALTQACKERAASTQLSTQLSSSSRGRLLASAAVSAHREILPTCSSSEGLAGGSSSWRRPPAWPPTAGSSSGRRLRLPRRTAGSSRLLQTRPQQLGVLHRMGQARSQREAGRPGGPTWLATTRSSGSGGNGAMQQCGHPAAAARPGALVLMQGPVAQQQQQVSHSQQRQHPRRRTAWSAPPQWQRWPSALATTRRCAGSACCACVSATAAATALSARRS